MKLIRGDKLTEGARRQVLAAFIHRTTTENGYQARNPCRARVPAISDAQWLAEHAFYITEAGKLARNRNYAEPAFMAGAE